MRAAARDGRRRDGIGGYGWARRRRLGPQNDVYACLGQLYDLLGALLGAVEELEEILQLTRVFVLDKSVRPPRRFRRPAEHGLAVVESVVLARDQGLPGLDDAVLVQ